MITGDVVVGLHHCVRSLRAFWSLLTEEAQGIEMGTTKQRAILNLMRNHHRGRWVNVPMFCLYALYTALLITTDAFTLH